MKTREFIAEDVVPGVTDLSRRYTNLYINYGKRAYTKAKKQGMSDDEAYRYAKAERDKYMERVRTGKHNPLRNKKKTSESADQFNPQDVVKIDIPLLIRLLEYAREDAKTDMDLHNLAEKLIKTSSEQNRTLTMQDYNSLVGNHESK